MTSTRIDQQQLAYAQAAFTTTRLLLPGDTVSQTVPASPGHDHWRYNAEITSTGPILTDVVLETFVDHGGHPMAYDQPVLKRIEFLGLEAEIAAPSGERRRVTIDLGDAVTVLAEQGSVPYGSTPGQPAIAEFQEGIWFGATVPVRDGDPDFSVLLKVELACPFRGAAADFDPPRAIDACPLFPQIAVTALTDAEEWDLNSADFRGWLTGFTGTVRLVGDVGTPAAMQSHMIDELFAVDGTPATPAERASVPTAPINYLALFTDMWNLHLNALAPQIQLAFNGLYSSLVLFTIAPNPITLAPLIVKLIDTAQVPPWLIRLGQAQWIAFFDYVGRISPRRQPAPGTVPPLAGGVRFVAVGAAGDPTYDVTRTTTADLPWDDIPGGLLHRPITKEPRQAGYDNMHLHGTMGTVGNISAADLLATPRVMAPGCGHSCFHAHWRWGNSTYFLSAADPAHPDLSVLSLVMSAAVSDALVFLFTETGVASEDAADTVAAWLWDWAAAVVAPPLADKMKGWTSDGPNSRSHLVPGAPLIPPNQRLDVQVGDEPEVGQPLDDPDEPPLESRRLLAAVKTVDLITTVDTSEPYSAAWKHCTTEFPVGVAVRYPESAAQELFRLFSFSYFLDLRYLPQVLIDQLITVGLTAPGTTAYSASRVFTDTYDVIPFLNFRDQPNGSFDARRLIHASNGGSDPVGDTTLAEL